MKLMIKKQLCECGVTCTVVVPVWAQLRNCRLGKQREKKYGFAIVCGVNNEWSPVP